MTQSQSSSTAVKSDSVKSDSEYSSTQDSTSFAELGVPQRIVDVLTRLGMTSAFPIQKDTLPDTLSGRDVLGRGETGSGKTLAYSIPLVAHLGETERDRRDYSNPVRGLILAPTRELVNQIDEVIKPMASAYNLKTTTIYGGVKYSKQLHELRDGAQIVIACPGRLEDLLRQGALKLDAVETTILDEADLMADLGFLPSVNRLLNLVPEDGQHLFFSATLDHGIDTLVRRFLTNPTTHAVDSATAQVETMTQHVFEVNGSEKPALIEALAAGQGKRILFTRTKHQAKSLADKLTKRGIPAAQLHGNLSQNQRDRNMAAFKSGAANVLVATDVASRGVDVPAVELVVQVDPPKEAKSFLHRSGRTARAGHSGDVVTLVLPDQRRETRRMLRQAAIKASPVSVTSSSPEVSDLVGPKADYVNPQELEKAMESFTRSLNKERGGSGSSKRGGKRRPSRNRNRNDRGNQYDRSSSHSGPRARKYEDSDRPARSEYSDRSARSDRSDRSDRYDRDDRPRRNDRYDHSDRRSDRSDRRDDHRGRGDDSQERGFRGHTGSKRSDSNPFSDRATQGKRGDSRGAGRSSSKQRAGSSSSHRGKRY